MKKNLIYLAVIAVALSSCGGGLKQGPGGLLYNIHEDKSGATIKEGDFVAINMIAKTEGDSVLSNTYTQGRPILAPIPKPQFKGDVVAGIMMLSEGDSATIKVNVDSMAKAGSPKQPGFKGKYIVFQLKVEKVIAKGNLAENVFQDRIKAFYTDYVAKVKNAEPAKVKKYIDDKKLKVTTTPSGLNYVINTQGTGAVPVAGDTVMVYYAGKMLNDELFETNIKDVAEKNKKFNAMNPYKPIPVVVGQQKVIPGWDEALLMMHVGTKATLVIPSKLAYGEQGMNPVIAPYTPLVFDVEMTGIKKPNPNAAVPAPPAPQPQIQVKK